MDKKVLLEVRFLNIKLSNFGRLQRSRQYRVALACENSRPSSLPARVAFREKPNRTTAKLVFSLYKTFFISHDGEIYLLYIYFKLSVIHHRRAKKMLLISHLNAHLLEHMLTDVSTMENQTKQVQRMISLNISQFVFLVLQRWTTTKL